MTQAEYNAKVQEIQVMWGDENCRFWTHRSQEGVLRSVDFQVSFDGWHTLGTQHEPFTGEYWYEWCDLVELKLRGAFAGAAIHS